MRKTNRSYWSISEFSEKFGSATIPVKLREGWSRKIFPNQISHAQALSRQACVNFTTALHSWSGPARLCIQTDEGKDDAHIERMEKRPVNTSSSFALISASPARRLPWNCMFSRWKSCFFFIIIFLILGIINTLQKSLADTEGCTHTNTPAGNSAPGMLSSVLASLSYNTNSRMPVFIPVLKRKQPKYIWEWNPKLN